MIVNSGVLLYGDTTIKVSAPWIYILSLDLRHLLHGFVIFSARMLRFVFVEFLFNFVMFVIICSTSMSMYSSYKLVLYLSRQTGYCHRISQKYQHILCFVNYSNAWKMPSVWLKHFPLTMNPISDGVSYVVLGQTNYLVRMSISFYNLSG